MALGVNNQHLVINAVFNAKGSGDPFALAMQRRGKKAISEMPEVLKDLPRTLIPLTAGGVLGVAALRDLGRYHREVTRQTSGMPEAVQNLLPRLRDPEFTRVLIVTLPEATPVHEAAQLQRDLRRAEIVQKNGTKSWFLFRK